MPTETDPIFHERRKFRRFPVALKLVYRLRSGGSGTGETANISSGGVQFRCDTVVPVGHLIEVDLKWPYLLDDRQPLLLRLYGMTLRSGEAGTAMSSSKHEYRLAGI